MSQFHSSRVALFFCIVFGATGCFYPKLKANTNSTSASSRGGSGSYVFKTFGIQFGSTYPGIGSSAGNESGYAITFDSQGNKIIAGGSFGNLGGTNSGSNDAVIIKVDSSGNLLWIKQLSTSYSPLILSATGADVIYNLAIDSSDNIYFGGTTYSSMVTANGGNGDVLVGKVDSSGSLIWIKQFTTSYSGLITSAAGDESANSITVDASGNVYVTGITDGSFGGANGGSSDAFVAKMDSSGSLTWIKQLTNAYSGLITNATGLDTGFGISVDSVSGNIYIEGFTASSLGGANAGKFNQV